MRGLAARIAHEIMGDAGLWSGIYATTNASEYWATSVQLSFDAIDRLDVKGRDELPLRPDARRTRRRADAGGLVHARPAR
ncbi:MAG: hypothetical protein ACRDV7_04660 [Acidimicrobiia bacterium]